MLSGAVRDSADPRRPPAPSPTPSGESGATRHPHDLALARAALDGDPGARRRFAERMRCVPRIMAARNAQMGRPLGADDVADLAQEAVLRVWAKLGTYAGRSSLEAWAYGFCSLELMNEIRRADRRPRTVADDDGEGAGPLERQVAAVDLDAGLVREEGEGWLAHLAPREREVVRLRHFEGLEAKEIAEALAITVSSVKTHYYRALEKLRRWVPDPQAPDRREVES